MDQDGSLYKRFGTNHIPRYYLGDGSRRSMRWIRMDQRTEGCVGMAFSAPGKGFEDGSRRSIGWIDMDCYRGDLAQLTFPAITWAMDQDGSAHRGIRRSVASCASEGFGSTKAFTKSVLWGAKRIAAPTVQWGSQFVFAPIINFTPLGAT